MNRDTNLSLAPTWRGPYASWDEAETAAISGSLANPGSLFDSREWLARQASFRESLCEGDMGDGLHSFARSSSIPLLAQGLEHLRVVDLGGGSGWVYDLLKRSRLSIKEYVVIDRPEVCAYFGTPKDGPRTFVTFDDWRDLVREQRPWDVVYCNSSLQYAQSNELLADITQKLGPRWVLLDDTLVTRSTEDVYAVQVNSDRPEAVRFLSVTQLAREMLPRGFRLEWRSPFAQPGYANRAQSTDWTVLEENPVPQTLLFRSV